MEIFTYQTIAASVQAEFKDKGSSFTAYAYPVRTESEVKEYVDKLKQEHHKARHHCYAYRIGVDGNRFRANDDGEPAGSAGRPILGQIDSFGLTDVLVVVVRYFGGTLLGVPGLIRAYKSSTEMALCEAQIIEKNIEKTVLLRCEYPHLSQMLTIGRQHQAQVLEQDLQLDCRITFSIPLSSYRHCLDAWMETRQAEIIEQAA